MKRNFADTLNLLCKADPKLVKNGAINSAAVARATKIAQGTIHRMLKGESSRPSPINEKKLMGSFGVTANQLYGYDPIPGVDDETARRPGSSFTENVEPLRSEASRVPLISWVKAGEYCESPDNFDPGDAEGWLETPFNHGPYAFCLRVSGPSMLPDYRDGEIILVDPDTEAEHNSDVVVRTPDPGPRQTFKRLQITPEGTYLLALNPDWENRIIAMPEGTEICGVVIGSWIKRR